jgi:hypothetical protein
MVNIEQVIRELGSSENYEIGVHPLTKILKDVPEGKHIYKNDLLVKLRKELNNKNAKMVEYLISITDHDGVDEDYTDVFCKLLKEDWHYMHEDIIMMLEDIKDPDSIPCIYEISLRVSEFVEGLSLAKKCIWALGAINTVNAREKLKLIAHSNDPEIREAALLELQDED